MTTARDLANRSTQLVGARDREGWIDLFAGDAVVEDPVGPSEWDPEGKGHRGKAGIARFWDMAIAPNRSVSFEVHRDYLCADETARVVTLHIVTGDGAKMAVPCIICYRKTDEGKLASLRAFWEAEQITFND